jgi:hypothetical protein
VDQGPHPENFLMHKTLTRFALTLSAATCLFTSVAEAQEAAKETYPPAWFRIDSDFGGLQLWAGATHPLSDTIGLASDIYVSGTLGEFDLGPAITAGNFLLTPMLGIQFDWAQRQATAIVPQFYLVGGPDPIYMELWIQNYIGTLFDYPSEGAAVNFLHTRFFLDYKVSKYFGIGPEIEANFALNSDDDKLVSLPIGANVMLSNYGVGNTLFIFLGYETKKLARDSTEGNAVAGRLTFVKNF